MARITIYKNSILANLFNLLGYVLMLSGIAIALGGEIVPGIVLALIGFGSAVLASSISENKRFKSWKKEVEAKGYVPAIQSSVQVALQVYNTYPCTKALEYICTLNPEAARIISNQISAKKSSGK